MDLNHLKSAFQKVQDEMNKVESHHIHLGGAPATVSKKMEQIILQHSPQDLIPRISDEYFQFGPLGPLMQDEDVTEILINGPDQVWYEKQGRLAPFDDHFMSLVTFRNFIERICQHTSKQLTVEYPTVDTDFRQFRLSIVGKELTGNQVHITMRRHPKIPWTFERLLEHQWCSSEQMATIREIVFRRESFLIVGSTGAGKTSILNSCLQLLPNNERVVVIEDTAEVFLPNRASMRLLTREDPHGLLPKVGQADLVKRALRLRPDRLAMGEIRFEEAKDFLMALSTGHSGGFGTLHASDPQQALIRLEMLVQMGAPQWNILAIRRLIQLGLSHIVIAHRSSNGQRRCGGIFRIGSLEENGFLVEQLN